MAPRPVRQLARRPGGRRTARPDALELDTFDGRAWLSAVPFTNVDVRPRFLPTGSGFPLPELNLRTYVTYDGTCGVYFFSLDADGVLGVLGARLLHHLPYYRARIEIDADGDRIRFSSRRRHPGARPVRLEATYGPTGGRYLADPGTRASFLTERYRYYTEAMDGRLRYAEIDHEPWPLYDAAVEIRANELFGANGFAVPDTEPVHLYSPGVETIASASARVDRTGACDSR